MQIYEVAQQNYSDLPVFSPEYRIITAIIGGTVSSLSDIDIAQIESVLQDVFTEVNYSIIDETDYKNAFQRLQFQMHSCNRIILIGHSQGNFYTNALFEETISTYQYSDGYLASDYPLVSLAAIATPTSSIGGSLGEEYKEIISHLTLDEDWVIRAVRILFGSLPSNYSAESLFDSTGHGLIAAYLRNNAVANAISAKIEASILNQTPFPLFEQHPVNSDAFSHIGYSTINKILDLKFESGSVYRYYNIPILVWDELYYSTSMGKVFNDNIRGQYPFDKLDIESMTYLKMTSLEPVAKVEK
ncbi:MULTISPECIES: KTSC domain-containing protein [unclassified Pseudoalteromonas]|uniref:KTSC domain-containing protein n=1 Tax=unclassified Pseudoalteromonas TaxID=194690 RepID=UPI0021760925|nr:MULTISPECIES: KTSC domain-containing protein [unclassified Pseudoalteromonas]